MSTTKKFNAATASALIEVDTSHDASELDSDDDVPLAELIARAKMSSQQASSTSQTSPRALSACQSSQQDPSTSHQTTFTNKASVSALFNKNSLKQFFKKQKAVKDIALPQLTKDSTSLLLSFEESTGSFLFDHSNQYSVTGGTTNSSLNNYTGSDATTTLDTYDRIKMRKRHPHPKKNRNNNKNRFRRIEIATVFEKIQCKPTLSFSPSN